ncbi:MAG TPA: hypothetical protein VGC56_07425 [Allosphingosinicella sp.]|jgi:hypothetical protein
MSNVASSPVRDLTNAEMALVAGASSSDDRDDPVIWPVDPGADVDVYLAFGGYDESADNEYDTNSDDVPAEGDPIIVTGHRLSDNDDGSSWQAPDWWSNPYLAPGVETWGGSGDVPEASHDPLTPHQIEVASKIIQARAAALRTIVEEHPGIQVNMPDHTLSDAAHMLGNLDKALTAIQAGTLGYEIAVGDKDFHDAIAFAFGLTAAAMAAEAEAPAVFEFLIGEGAEYAANHMVDWIDATKVWINDEAHSASQEVQHWVETHQDQTGDNRNPIQVYQGMFGIPISPQL